MSKAISNLEDAQHRAMAGRPKVGGFPYLAEILRRAGVARSVWSLPACQCLYLTHDGPVMMQATPLIAGTVDVPRFDREALLAALRVNQAGDSSFPQFLAAAWQAGIIRYEVDFLQRVVTYFGQAAEYHEEPYPAVAVP
jgi:uncharacterized protein YbcV (DUF1398 family)